MISGVCNGVAAYFGVDPTVVRLIFVLLLLVSSGMWILVYLVLMFVVPVARTAEERAAARGQPFNAQELIDETKRRYSDLKEGTQRWRDKRGLRFHLQPAHWPFNARLADGVVIAATEAGLGAFITAAVNEVDVDRMLGLDGIGEGVVAILGCGHPAPGGEVLRLSNYVLRS